MNYPRSESPQDLAGRIRNDLKEASDIEQVLDRHLPAVMPVAPSGYLGRVDAISIQGIRSFGPRQVLSPSPRLTIVYAGNGVGKTSFVDALELHAVGATTRAQAHGGAAGEVRDTDHIPHLDSDGVAQSWTPRVEVQWVDSENVRHSSVWSGTFGTPASGAPVIELIARRRLREAVQAPRAERIERLAPSLGLGQAVNQLTAIANVLSDQAKKRAEQDRIPAAVLASIDNSGPLDARALVTWADKVLGQRGGELPPVSATLAGWQRLERDVSDHVRGRPGAGAPERYGLIRLLRGFLAVAEVGAQCPACLAGKVTPNRLAEVEQQIAGSEALDLFDSSSEELAREIARLRGATTRLYGQWRADYKQVDDADLAALRRLERSWLVKVEQLESVMGQVVPTDVAGMHLVVQKLSELDDVRSAVAALPSHNQGDGMDDCDDDIIAAAKQAKENPHGLLRSIREQPARQRMVEMMMAAVDALYRRRTPMVESALGELAGAINDWMVRLAPEGTGRLELRVLPLRGRARPVLEIHTEAGVNALGRLSDSQIDMLGLAAHLARIDRDSPRAMVVIDDPSDMLDKHATERLASQGIKHLLTDRQVVVLTHDDQLVRSLWAHHRSEFPLIHQEKLETIREGEDSFAQFEPRRARASLTEANNLIHDAEVGLRRHDVGVRARLGVYTRRAVELFAKEVGVILGPAGVSRTDDPFVENLDLHRISQKILPLLEQIETEFRRCGAPAHCADVSEVVATRHILGCEGVKQLNPGAHSDVVLPEVSTCKEVLRGLGTLIRLLDGGNGTWPRDSEMARIAAGCACADRES
ncbi:hypothetical protein CGZ98_05100 [Enemella evansiae]|uniref:ATP-binding protein n=1 Tax=Enemella evansiae TaxID=2016499 RepID=UPI000B97A7DD|nr:ATP-binding protein [Enemella evansiae]OYO13805.1 hypothetical protein CGZ98_05100 [Enemella evansiae]